MNDFCKNLAALIKVKTIVTLVVIGVFAALALSGAIPSDTTMAVVTMVVAFYFGTQSKKRVTCPHWTRHSMTKTPTIRKYRTVGGYFFYDFFTTLRPEYDPKVHSILQFVTVLNKRKTA